MIHFKSVSYKNFLSTGNTPNVILLDRTPSALITGQNGAGKSTILDAICFGLFGKPYRNINKPQLMNTVNEKNMVVEINFSVNNTQFRVVRGEKPKIFEIYRNDVLIEHDAAIKDYQLRLEEILGLNYKAFTQIVILGSARYQSFMDLSTNDRRTIIEEILDITVFSKMNAILKTRMQNNDLDIKENNYQKDIINTKISGQKGLIKSLLNRSKESDEKIQEQKSKAEAEKTLLEKKVAAYDSEINTKIYEDIALLKAELAEKKYEAKQLASTAKEIEGKKKFYETESNCHTCGQEIAEEIKTDQLKSLSEQRQSLVSDAPRIKTAIEEYENRIRHASDIEKDVTALIDEKRNVVSEIKTQQKIIENLQNQHAGIDGQELEEAKADLQEMQEEFKMLEKESINLSEQSHHLEICKILLKDDGIKAKIIKQYLPIINQMINQYLDRMGANYSFNLDEQFNEVIKSRYRDTFSYASFSEGEKMRIDLALMFTWREVAKLKNSINTNLLIMDEVGDSSLDADATDILWDIVGNLEDTNVFVISHKATNGDKFRSLIEFVKDGNFSKIRDSKV